MPNNRAIQALKLLFNSPELPAVSPAPTLSQPANDLYPDMDFYSIGPDEAQDEAMWLHRNAGPNDAIRPKRPTDYGGIQIFDRMNAYQNRVPMRQLEDVYWNNLDKLEEERRGGASYDEIQSPFRKIR